MGPRDGAKTFAPFRRLEEPRSAKLRVTLRRQARNDQLTVLVPEKSNVAVRRQVRGRPALFSSRLEGFPQSGSRRDFDSAKGAIAIHSIKVLTAKLWG